MITGFEIAMFFAALFLSFVVLRHLFLAAFFGLVRLGRFLWGKAQPRLEDLVDDFPNPIRYFRNRRQAADAAKRGAALKEDIFKNMLIRLRELEDQQKWTQALTTQVVREIYEDLVRNDRNLRSGIQQVMDHVHKQQTQFNTDITTQLNERLKSMVDVVNSNMLNSRKDMGLVLDDWGAKVTELIEKKQDKLSDDEKFFEQTNVAAGASKVAANVARKTMEDFMPKITKIVADNVPNFVKSELNKIAPDVLEQQFKNEFNVFADSVTDRVEDWLKNDGILDEDLRRAVQTAILHMQSEFDIKPRKEPVYIPVSKPGMPADEIGVYKAGEGVKTVKKADLHKYLPSNSRRPAKKHASNNRVKK